MNLRPKKKQLKNNKTSLNTSGIKGKLDSYIVAQILNLNYNIEKWTQKDNEK